MNEESNQTLGKLDDLVSEVGKTHAYILINNRYQDETNQIQELTKPL